MVDNEVADKGKAKVEAPIEFDNSGQGFQILKFEIRSAFRRVEVNAQA